MICKLIMMTDEVKSAAPSQRLLYASEDQVAKQQHGNNQSFSCPNRHVRTELNCRNVSLETDRRRLKVQNLRSGYKLRRNMSLSNEQPLTHFEHLFELN